MNKEKKLILMKSLPNCPKGRIFKEDINGNFFHSMSDEEHVERKFKLYKFTKEEILENSDWFSDYEYADALLYVRNNNDKHE